MPLCKRKHAETVLATHCLGRTPPDSVLRTEPFGILFKMPTTTTKLSRNKTSRSQTPQNMHVCMKKAERSARDSVMDRGSTRKNCRPTYGAKQLFRTGPQPTINSLRPALLADTILRSSYQPPAKTLGHHEPSGGNRFRANSNRPHDSRKVRRIPLGRQGPSRNSIPRVAFSPDFKPLLRPFCFFLTLPKTDLQ